MGKIKLLSHNLFDIRRRPKDTQKQQARILRGVHRSRRKPGPARAKMQRRR